MKGVYCKMFPAKHLRLLVCPRDMVAAGGADQHGPLSVGLLVWRQSERDSENCVSCAMNYKFAI